MKKNRLFIAVMMVIVLFGNFVFADIKIPEEGRPIGIVAGIAKPILGIIKAIAYAVAFGMVLVIGIKYMSKGAGAKAEVKDTFLPYFIGAFIVGFSSSIVSMVMGWGF